MRTIYYRFKYLDSYQGVSHSFLLPVAMVGLVVAVVFGLVLIVDGLLGGEVVLLSDGVDDVVGDGPHCAMSAHAYASFRLRIYYWSITSLFFANSFRISARTA